MTQKNAAENSTMTTQTPKAIQGDPKPALHGQRFQELDASTAAMLESQEVPALQGSDEEWWCPNPTCEVVDK